MSGIEAIALVIGIWPIISNGVSAYRAMKDSGAVDEIQHKIKFQHNRFRRLARKLLLGDEELTEADRCRLTNPSDGDASSAWSDKGLQDRMKERFGLETYELIVSAACRILELFRNLETRLKSGEVDISSFRGRLKGSMRQLRVNMPHSRLQVELAKVKESLDELCNLIESDSDPAYAGSQYSAGQRPRRHSATVKRQKRLAAQLFDDFHDVIVGSYCCQCTHGHEANLRVYDDGDWFEVLFVVEDEAERALSVQSQQALSPESGTLDDSGPESIASGSPVVGAVDCSVEFHDGCWSSSRLASEEGGRKRKTLPMIFSVDLHGSSSQPISNLCQFVRTIDRSNLPGPIKSVGTLSDGDRSYTARLERASVDSLGACVVCLDDCLSGGQDLSLPSQKRFDLAQNLAGFLLQVHATKWIDEAWTWRNFSIKDDGDDKRPQLFVTRTFFSEGKRLEEQQAKLSVFWRYVHQQPLLVRLAFALIELGLNQRLYELRHMVKDCDLSDGSYTEDEKDYHTALWLLRHGKIREETSLTYHKVVEACLHCTVLMDTGATAQTSRADTLHDYLENYISRPLRDHFIRNWGDIVSDS